MLSPALRTVGGLFGIFCCIAIATAPVQSQDAPKKPPLSIPKPAPSIPKPASKAKDAELEGELDLVKLLHLDMVFPQSTTPVTDGIWEVPATDGRMILRIPLKITKPTEPVIASGAIVKVRGARFICWQLIDPTEEGKPANSTAPTAINPVGTDALPVGVPRMTRTVRIDPEGQGKVSWKLDRAILGAKVADAQTPGPYVYKLNPATLEKLNPGLAPRTLKMPGESPADYLKRKQPIDEEYRKKASVYREVRSQLIKLPDEFEGPMPPTLWAVYETRANAKTIDIEGPAPLPWEFPIELLIQLQRVMAPVTGATAQAATPLGSTGLTFSTAPVEDNLLKVLNDPKIHPMSLRIIAHAITLSGWLEKMAEGDSKYQVVEKLLAGKDSVATAEVMKYLAIHPSEAAASLVEKAIKAGQLDATAQLSSIKGMMSAIEKNPQANVENAIITINKYLADAKGPDARAALAPLLDLARAKPTMADQILKAMRIDAPAGKRRDEVIISIIEAAMTEPVAIAALDRKLLGSDDATLVERTLFLISQAVRPKMDLTSIKDAGGKPIAFVTPQTKLVVVEFWAGWCPPCVASAPKLVKFHEQFAPKGVAMLGVNDDKDRQQMDAAVQELKFTWPQAWIGSNEGIRAKWGVTGIPAAFVLAPSGQMLWRGSPDELEATVTQLLTKSTSEPAAAPADELRPQLAGDVLIDDVKHNIFKLFNDAKVANLAWAALPHMRMANVENAGAERLRWPLTLVEAAVTRSPTPVAAARFLAKHHEPNVTEALVQLVIRADNDASAHASTTLLGSGVDLGPVLAKLAADSERPSFGVRLYENIAEVAPYSVGLLRDKSDSAKVADWFGSQIASGKLPEPAQWVRAYPSIEHLFDLIRVDDDSLALGAIGTLVASAGGGPGDVNAIAAKLRANKNATNPELVRMWNGLRKELFAKKLKGASTSYALSLRIGQPINDTDVQWAKPVPLGDVAMQVAGDKVTINKATATVAADDVMAMSLSLPIDQLKQLAPTGNAAISSLTPGTSEKTLTILPQGATGWFAEFSLADGRKAEISLEAKQ